MLQLRDYQESAIQATMADLFSNPLLVAPTGAGKTVMGATMVQRLNGRTLWLAHRRELIAQAARQLRDLGLSVGIIKAGVEPTPDARVQVASVQTLARRTMPEGIDNVVIDEAHHATADSYRDVINAGPPVIGLTATPFRLSGEPLDMFGSLHVAAYADELMDAGHLIDPRVRSHSQPDMSGARIMRGDFAAGQLADRCNMPDLIGDIVSEWRKHALGLRTVCFAVNVEHSYEIVDEFYDAGVAAEHLDGDTPEHARDAILARLASGETQVVSNCLVLTEGWDLPTLECVIAARPTASLNLHLQMIGRVLRPHPDKRACIILDHAGNHCRHGSARRRHAYSLGGAVTTSPDSDELGLKTCPHCYVMYALQLRRCPACGGENVAQIRTIRVGEGSLKEYVDALPQVLQGYWNNLRLIAEANGYQHDWLVGAFAERFEFYPLVVDDLVIDPKTKDQGDKERAYGLLCRRAHARDRGFGWADHRYREYFGVWPTRFKKDVQAQTLLNAAIAPPPPPAPKLAAQPWRRR